MWNRLEKQAYLCVKKTRIALQHADDDVPDGLAMASMRR
jgi:hypothetical protein